MNTLGLKRGTVALREYDPQWAVDFAVERERLLGQFPDVFLEISHGGSTAVPGMKAKPIIDMFCAVRELDDDQKVKVDLEGLGYEYRGEAGVPDRRLFVKGGEDCRTHHLHLVTKASEQWQNHLLLRDYYIRHPEVAQAYVALKEELAAQHPNDRGAYTSGKENFIASVLQRAREEMGQ